MSNSARRKIVEQHKEIERLRAALEKIADWNGSWGPFPERNEAWCSMAVVTAREAVPLPPNAMYRAKDAL